MRRSASSHNKHCHQLGHEGGDGFDGDSIVAPLMKIPIHCIRMKCPIFWDGACFWDFFLALKNMLLWSFKLNNTDAADKVTFSVAASRHSGTSVAEGSPQRFERDNFGLSSFRWGIVEYFSKTNW